MDENVLLELKPKFIPDLRFICNLPIDTAYGCTITMLILCILPLLVGIFEINSLVWIFKIYDGQYAFTSCMGILFGLIFLGSIIATFIDKKNFATTSYTIYKDRIEYKEGFINYKQTCILAEDIKEIHYTQNFLQLMSKVGSIKITTAGNIDYKTGILIKDIEDSRNIYNQIKEIFEK